MHKDLTTSLYELRGNVLEIIDFEALPLAVMHKIFGNFNMDELVKIKNGPSVVTHPVDKLYPREFMCQQI